MNNRLDLGVKTQQYGGYDLFQTAEFKANVSIKV